MSRYRKIDVRIWNDAKFASLDDKGKLAFFMLLTHPAMTPLGAMRATPSGLAEELGWSTEDFREAFAKICGKGMAKHDERVHLIALPNFIRYNPPVSPNVVKAWEISLDMLPECDLKNEVIQTAKAFAEGMSKGFGKALPKAFLKGAPKSIGIQEQEQEQEKEQDIKDGREEEELASTHARETFTDELPLDPPETVEAARIWLIGQGIPNGDRLERAVYRAMRGKLLQSDIEALKVAAA
ncbi:MAG: hypothetical protein EOS52_19125 [Mesorhizobium sp.]|uniref:hypothetical protein n=1 Tax=Mesorhizobium sp. TaxID=1871066 RepID=UPI000FE51C4D|nr:hypothetical protein [Mesorhizobium sp.]RWC12355.1 MAG: hypothetical protein EOS52_19125 [Mesorhizobium sp.]